MVKLESAASLVLLVVSEELANFLGSLILPSDLLLESSIQLADLYERAFAKFVLILF